MVRNVLNIYWRLRTSAGEKSRVPCGMDGLDIGVKLKAKFKSKKALVTGAPFITGYDSIAGHFYKLIHLVITFLATIVRIWHRAVAPMMQLNQKVFDIGHRLTLAYSFYLAVYIVCE